ncbi:hypothetical protein L596_001049 [Steinernema carpocapsae]|uniref:Uncharacterized protein n=1 Tax=Steinernema carpocapsae TaxID=34508 RepID=A0A4U8UJV0_STECR|nr:hypothetical protein L596_001049 [Steinernema carpocapsae]
MDQPRLGYASSPETWECWLQIHGRIQGFTKTLPRSVCPIGAEVDLVVFTDASQDVMATCIYLIRVDTYHPLQNGDPTYHPSTKKKTAHLVASKTKQRPLQKVMTIPKMELDAISLGTKLLNSVMTDLRNNIKVQRCAIMTDSQIALEWIRAPRAPAKQGAFVLNRWKELRALQATLESYHHELWTGYVRTDENPADCATRGLSKDELGDHNWWIGPDYLSKDFEDWPNTANSSSSNGKPMPTTPTEFTGPPRRTRGNNRQGYSGSHRAERASGNNGWNSHGPYATRSS